MDLHDIPKLLKDRDKWRKRNPLLVETLNKAQQKFMDCITWDRRLPRRIIFVGSNKIGKTTMGVKRGVCLAVGEHPFMPENHPLRYLDRIGWHKPSIGLVAGETLTQTIQQKMVPEYLRQIPDICKPITRKNSQGVITEITLQYDLRGEELGSKIYLRSYDSPAETYEGIDYDWIHWDEPPPNDIFVSAERGLLATNGISYLTFTSLKEPWLHDLAMTSIDYGGDDLSTRVVESGPIWGALKENGGHLDKNAIEDFIKICPAEEYNARILGKWMVAGTRIYKTFKDAYPFVVPDFEIPRYWNWYESIDPADGRDTRWLFAAVAPYDIDVTGMQVNRIFVVDWLAFPPGTPLSEMKRRVEIKRTELGYREPVSIILDRMHGKRRQATMQAGQPATWHQKLTELDIGYIKLSASKRGDVDLGHKIVIDYLKLKYFSVGIKQAQEEVPGLVFLERCRGKGGPIESMLKYKRQTASDKPEEDYKDWCDTVRYLCMLKPTYQTEVRVHRKTTSSTNLNRFTGS